ncbi:hypothetical protein RIF29_18162 [Crotalaria pallida]|uniref:Uncharacterized protein n=1 Tax=Crotalaria pallida TaxID=3830 RepID=A0AAN9IDN2_CROPI
MIVMVVDASARSLRMIYRSKLAPKYDFFQLENMDFLLSLLKSENENLTELGASIVIRSCETSDEQNMLCYAGVLEKLVSLLDGSSGQRDAGLESVAAILKNNPDAVSKFVDLQSGRVLSSVIQLTKDRYPRTKLLASLCLICVKNSSCHLQDTGIKTKLLYVLLELLDDPGQVGDEAFYAFSSLIAKKEDLQKLAYEANAVDKFCHHLQNCALHPKRLEGIFLALAHLCSKLECCRSKFLSLQVLNQLVDALIHGDEKVRAAACIFLNSVSRSIKFAEHLEVLDPQRATLVREMYPIGDDTLYSMGILTCSPGGDCVVHVPAPVGDPSPQEELSVVQPAATADEDVEMQMPVAAEALTHDTDSIRYHLNRLSLQVQELSDSFMDYAASQEARGVRMEVQLAGIYQMLQRHFDHQPQQ